MTEEFDRLMREVGETILRDVEGVMSGQQWLRASLDVRYAEDGSSWVSRLRVNPSAEEDADVEVSMDIHGLLIDLNSQRRLFGSEWFGLMLVVHPMVDVKPLSITTPPAPTKNRSLTVMRRCGSRLVRGGETAT